MGKPGSQELEDKIKGYRLYGARQLSDVAMAWYKAQQQVNEAFDQPYRLKWEAGDYGDVDAYAKLDDGTYLSIMFNKGYNQDKEEAWNVEFFRNNSQEVTGEGDQQRVFATVLSAIQKFIKKYKPNKVIFSASKEVDDGQKSQSRARLYDSLVQRYARAWGFRAFRADAGNKVIYELSKIKKDVAEGTEQINEYRDRLLQYVKGLLPTWPDYVLKDWLVPNKGDFSNLPADALKNSVMEKVQGAGLTTNTKWQLIPDMKFTMDMFDPKTKQLLAGRAGGKSDLGMGIPKDAERHATQAQLAKQQGGVRKEPVLLIKSANGYELLEGWHRTIQHFHMYPDGYTGPAYVAVAQGLTEGSGNNIPTIGINVRSDGDIDYASLIVDGKKKYESRKTDSLRPYVGKTVGIVRTGNGPAVAIGQVTIGEPIVVDAEKFNRLRKQHLVPQGSKFDIDSDGTKYLYPMINPVRWDNEKPIKNKGIVSRKMQEQDVEEGFFDRFKKQLSADRNGIHLTATKDERRLIVDAIYNDERIGNAIFQVQGKNLVAAGVGVAREYQGKGIGKIMYDWVKELGYTLNRSPHQTDAGKGFWDKHKGVEQNVWEASGYIPSEKEKNDPRFKTALTKDVKPDSIKKNAKAFSWLTSRAGIPPQAKTNGKV
jgi:predicted transcriptional regulator/GNAT superfamily N-acetyltransferase